MVINRFLIAFMLLLGCSSSWAGIRERFDYKVKRSAEGTEIYLYSIPDNYKETRVYDKNGYLRSVNSRVGDVSLEVTPNSMLFQKSDAKFYQRYYFEKSGKAFVLTRMTQGQPEVYHKRSDSLLQCALRTNPVVSQKKTVEEVKQPPESCQLYASLLDSALNRLRDEKVRRCLGNVNAMTTVERINDGSFFSELECDSKALGSEHNTGSTKIQLGQNFLNAHTDKARAEVLLHELLHASESAYGRKKEENCGTNLIGDIEEEVDSIAKGCLSDSGKVEAYENRRGEAKALKEKIEANLKPRIVGHQLVGNDIDFVLPDGGVTQKEWIYFYSEIEKRADRFTGGVLADREKCNDLTKEILGKSCPFVNAIDKELGCVLKVKDKVVRIKVPDEIAKLKKEALERAELAKKTGTKPSADAAVAPVTAASLSSDPIPVMNQRLPASVEAIHQQIPDMLPDIETSSSVGSPRQLMNDLQAAAKNLVMPIATADTNYLPASVQNRLRTIQASAPAEPSSKAVSAFKMEFVAKSLVNTALADQPTETASKSGPVVKISNKPVVKEVAVSKSSVAPEGTSQALTGTSAVGSSGSGPVSAKVSAPAAVAKSQAVSLDHNPEEYLNRVFASRAQSEQVIKDLKAREAELKAKNIQVIIGNERIGSLTPKRKLKWDGTRFVEQKN